MFLYGGLELLHDPFLMKGMREAADRIKHAVERSERIRIYGDYDADGVSSTALMSRLMRALSADFDHYVPHRTAEGYGLNMLAIDAAAEAGVTLIVTVDNGISAVEEIAYARERGIDVVVTDHHEPPERLPEAAALVNPKQPDCPYPFKGLAGVGVAFKLAHALLGRPPLEWTELAALGTIADLMPLQDENRVIVKLGLEQLRRTSNAGFRALAAASGIELTAAQAESIAFGMAPRINAAGRLQHADTAVRLLLTDDPHEAETCAAELDQLNRQRQKLVDEMVVHAEAIWAERCRQAAADGGEEPSVIVVAGEGWNVGVVGIVASKLIERHYRPAFVLGIDAETGTAKGSARSIDGFDLHAALTACEELLDHYGGHQAAAGMTLRAEQLPQLEAKLSAIASQVLTEEHLRKKTTIDLVCTADEATLEATAQIALLEPFGAGNPQPKLLLANLPISEKRAIGKEGKHLRLGAARKGGTLEAIGFGFGELAELISDTACVDIVGELTVNEWNGSRKPQIMLRDIRVPHVQLYDGRGRRDKDQGVRQAIEQMKRLSALRPHGHGPGPAVVLTADSAVREAAAAAEPADGKSDGSAYMLRHYDESVDAGGLRTIVLLDRPPDAERLAALLQTGHRLEAVWALYDQDVSGMQFPTRDAFGNAYRLLRGANGRLGRDEALALLAKAQCTPQSAQLMLDVFAELEFIVRDEAGILVADKPARRELSESPSFRAAQRQAESERLWSAPARELAEWIAANSPAGRAQ